MEISKILLEQTIKILHPSDMPENKWAMAAVQFLEYTSIMWISHVTKGFAFSALTFL